MDARRVVEELTRDAQAAADDVVAEALPGGRQYANLSRTSVRLLLVKAYTLGWVAGVAFDAPAVAVDGTGTETHRD